MADIWNDAIQSSFLVCCPWPSGWKKRTTSGGRKYQYEEKAGPGFFSLPFECDIDTNGLRLPEGWTRQRENDSGSFIYINDRTKKTQRSTPLYQPGIANEAKPAVSDYQLFEKDLE